MTILAMRETWTVDDLDDLPRGLRCELHDGILEFRQPLTGWHRHVQYRLLALLEDAEVYADFEVGVSNGPRDTRIADVAIFHGTQHDEDAALAHYPPERLHTVVEVVSPRSKKKDGDPQWYADRGIPECWVVERIADETWDALITMSELVVAEGSGSAGYRETGRTTLKELRKSGYPAPLSAPAPSARDLRVSLP
jgi:Uma2 family endonuclease